MQPGYPQGYGPPPGQQYGYPPGYPQGYGPPAQAPPAMPPTHNAGAAAGAPPMMPEASDPVIGTAGTPKTAELVGRAVVIVPLNHDPNAKAPNGVDIRPSVTCRLFVLDGPAPFLFGSAPRLTPPRPPTHSVNALPSMHEGVVINGDNLLRSLVPQVGKGSVLGRIEISTIGNKGNKPYNIVPLDPADPARGIYEKLRADLASGAFGTGPAIVELAPPTPAQYPQAGPPPMPPGYGPPAPQGPAWAGPTHGQPGYGPPAQPQPTPASAAPPGFPQGAWDAMSPEQRAYLLQASQQAAQQTVPQASAGPPQQFPQGY